MSGQLNTYVSLKIDGADPASGDPEVEKVEITQELFKPSGINLALAFQVSQLEDVMKKATSSWLGKELVVTFKDHDDSSIEKSYTGTITSFSLGEGRINLYALSEDHLLTRGRKHRAFVENQGIDIVNTVVKDRIAKNSVRGPSASLNFKYLQQYQETDAEFLLRLARFDGCVFFHDGGEFVYTNKLGGRGSNVDLTLDHLQNVVLDCNLDATKWRGAPYDSTKHLDPRDIEIKSGKFAVPNHPALSKTYDTSQTVYPDAVEELYNEAVSSKSDFENFLKHQQAQAAGRLVLAIGETIHPSVVIGRTIHCSGHPLLEKPVVVTSLKAKFDEKGYHARFEALPEGSVVSPGEPDVRHHLGLLEPAVVVDNKDPNSLGRIQIQHLWDTDGRAYAWARMVQPGAGGKGGVTYGTHFTPRIGDQVLVGFENGDPSLPIVFGGLYHSETKPDFKTDNGTEEVLVVRTPQESTIRVLDKQGSEEIIVSMKDDKNTIRLELSGPKITVESKDGAILVKSKSIEFNASDLIELKANQVKIGTNQDFSVDAKGKSEIKATAGVTMTSDATMEIKANATCSVEGTAGLTLKNAAAQIAMNGPTVSVNNGALEVM